MTRLFFYICLCLAVVATVSCNSGRRPCGDNQCCPRNGRDGRDGQNGIDGRNGRNGIDGVDGLIGEKGDPGVNGTNGIGKDGQDGKDGKDAARKNWKECAWNNIDDNKDIGLIKDCDFKKKSTAAYLKVTVTTNMRLANCANCCKRWFVTFDGKECSPVPIDGIVYTDKLNNLHRPRTLVGHCKVSKTGNVNVGLNIGNCRNYGDSDGQTGWGSTRIIVEEVVPPQV